MTKIKSIKEKSEGDNWLIIAEIEVSLKSGALLGIVVHLIAEPPSHHVWIAYIEMFGGRITIAYGELDTHHNHTCRDSQNNRIETLLELNSMDLIAFEPDPDDTSATIWNFPSVIGHDIRLGHGFDLTEEQVLPLINELVEIALPKSLLG